MRGGKGREWRSRLTGLGDGVHFAPVLGEGEAVVACVGECHAGRGNHTTLAHEESRGDCEDEDGHDEFVG